MHVLQVHNKYREPGGEDQVVAAEARLLRGHGHEVTAYLRDNTAIASEGGLALAVGAVWNRQSQHEMEALLRKVKPDVMHCHNLQPLISPAVYYAAHRQGIPVVQTLHNYRLLCANSLLYRDGHTCERCSGRLFPWPALRHACYRDSRSATTVVVGVSGVHRVLGTWRRRVSRFIVLTEFAREKFADAGLPETRIVVKPNFVEPDPGPGRRDGGYALFVGRLSVEKGVRTLLAAWQGMSDPMPLVVVGDGPLAGEVRAASEQSGRIRWLGRQPQEEVHRLLGKAWVLVFPSECYETFGLAVAEAFAAGIPVICAGHGGAGSLVEHGRTGRHFVPGDPRDLAEQMSWAGSHPDEMETMSGLARGEFEARYTGSKNLDMLLAVYRDAVANKAGA